ncbi:MAG: riboflavin biosynthesis protein [Bacteroidia bacterium]|nr:MAG: riboflavin biosynthesis protein [Bacteroidia bacterium]
MIILNECPNFIDAKSTVITIGTFDGVHKGHQIILNRLSSIKKDKNLKSIVFTFYPHPRKIIQTSQPLQPIKILTTKDEKIQLLKNFDIDYLIFCPFTKEFANQPPDDFVKYLIHQLNVKYVIIGYDHRFGKDRKGDINTFLQLKTIFNFEVEQIPAETIDNINISSTKIRQFLTNGDIENANELLGYNYFITGQVIKGKQLGRQINFPTANIKVNDPDKLIPAHGVYCGEAKVKDKLFKAAINIGFNPTTNNDNLEKIEAHLLQFNEDIYGETIQIFFHKKIRNERKFDSLESLKNQITEDIKLCQ